MYSTIVKCPSGLIHSNVLEFRLFGLVLGIVFIVLTTTQNPWGITVGSIWIPTNKSFHGKLFLKDTMAVFDILVRAFSCAFMLAIPLGLFAYLRKEIRATWRWIGIGAATFVGSQVVHIPLNSFVLTPLLKVLGMGDMKEAKGIELFTLAVVLGLSSGVCEEVSRYLVYRYWLASNTYVDRSWRAAVSLGAGHGGCEAIILSFLLILTLFEMIELRHADLSKILPPDKVQAVQEELDAYWSMPWYESFMPAMERVSALTFHVSASVIVLQVFQRRNIWWLGAAIAFHAAIDAITVVVSVQKWNVLVTEALLAVLIIPFALIIIFYFRNTRSVDQEEALQPLLAADQGNAANEQEGNEPAADEEEANDEDAAQVAAQVSEQAGEESNEQASELVEANLEEAATEEGHSLC
jgi:uncharacterized membrane protein YhfC